MCKITIRKNNQTNNDRNRGNIIIITNTKKKNPTNSGIKEPHATIVESSNTPCVGLVVIYVICVCCA